MERKQERTRQDTKREAARGFQHWGHLMHFQIIPLEKYLKKRAVIAKRKSGKFNFEFGKKKFQKIIYSLQD